MLIRARELTKPCVIGDMYDPIWAMFIGKAVLWENGLVTNEGQKIWDIMARDHLWPDTWFIAPYQAR